MITKKEAQTIVEEYAKQRLTDHGKSFLAGMRWLVDQISKEEK